jgi:hypothetical protein
MTKYYYVLVLGSVACFYVAASNEKIELNNLIDQDTYAAFYNDKGVRSGNVLKIPALNIISAETPQTTFLSTTSYAILGAHNAARLTEKQPFTEHEFLLLSSVITDKKVKKIDLQHLGLNIGATAEVKSSIISIANMTEQDVYIALYYDDGHAAIRWGTPTLLQGNTTISLLRPEKKCRFKKIGVCNEFYDRNIYIASNLDDLQPMLKSYVLPQVNVGELKGSSFYIYHKEKAITGTHEAGWQLQLSKKTVQSIIKPELEAVKEKFESTAYPGKGVPVSVIKTDEVSPQEKAYRMKRMDKHVRPACIQWIEKKYGIKLPDDVQLPTIGLCVSGGGCRAMYVMSGFVAAAEEDNCLELLSYIATLSGSTWFLTGWMASGLSAAHYHRHIVGQLTNGITNKFDMQHIIESVEKSKAFNQDVSMVNVYGALLADKLLRTHAPVHNPNYVLYGTEQPRVDRAEVPFPLYTAVTPRQFSDLTLADISSGYYHWVLFDPYTVAIPSLKVTIPAYALGRTFKQGISEVSVPPLNLGYLMGIFGSAMSLNTRDAASVVVGSASPEMAERIVNVITSNDILKWLVQQRTSPAKIPNFAADGLMTLVDGGMSLIIPLPAFVQQGRNVDMMIILDAGAAIKYAPGPRGLNKYVKDEKIDFPLFDLNTVGKKPYTIAWNQQKIDSPAVLYIPMIGHQGYHNNWDPEGDLFSNTFNFTYTRPQAELLSGLGAYMFRATRDAFIEMLFDWIKQHNPNIGKNATQT